MSSHKFQRYLALHAIGSFVYCCISRTVFVVLKQCLFGN